MLGKLSFAAVTAAALFAGTVQARPITVQSTPTPNCDGGAPLTNHELGAGPLGGPLTGTTSAFSAGEDIAWTVSAVTQLNVCPSNSRQGALDTIVTITNLTGTFWQDLWFVADGALDVAGLGVLTNHDALVGEAGFGLAFRIDGLVTMGNNNPLLAETMTVDEIFEPGETWTFVIQDWGGAAANGGNLSDPCLAFPGIVRFASAGVGAISCTNETQPVRSNASIIARRIAEPATLATFGLGLLGFGLTRRKRAA